MVLRPKAQTNGILEVTAKDLGTHKNANIIINKSTRLSPKDKEKMADDAERYLEQCREKREEAEVRNKADSLLYLAERTKKDLTEKISQEQKSKIDSAITALKNALASEDITWIKAKSGELSESLQEVTAELYQQPNASVLTSKEQFTMEIRLLTKQVLSSFMLMPRVTVRTVCFDSSQKVYDFADLMRELFTKVGTKIYGYNDQKNFSFIDETENAREAILQAIKTNPSVGKGTAYVGRSVDIVGKDDGSIMEIDAIVSQLKSERLLPEEVIILPIDGATINQKKLMVEKTLELIQSLGDLDWQMGLPSIVVAITDGDREFLDKLNAQKMAQFHALSFGYET